MGDVAVFNVEGGFCATQARCTHRQGPLSEGTIDGSTVTCPLHGAQFNVWTGAVLRGPAKDPLKTYRVTVDGEVGRVEVPLAQASSTPQIVFGQQLTVNRRPTPNVADCVRQSG